MAIEFVDELKQILRGAVGGRRVHPTGEAEVVAGFDFTLHVQLGRGIFSDEDCGESWAPRIAMGDAVATNRPASTNNTSAPADASKVGRIERRFPAMVLAPPLQP